MRSAILAGSLAICAASLVQPAKAAIALGGHMPLLQAAPAMQAQPVEWVWHGRHWNHRRWAPRVRVAGRWVPGHYSYY